MLDPMIGTRTCSLCNGYVWSRIPSYASIREWLIAGVAMRKDRRQRLLPSSLKISEIKLNRIASSLI